MHKTTHTVTRNGDKLTLTARWLDGLKRPAAVQINILKGDHAPLANTDAVIVQGDVGDVDGILIALADIAWQRGWRPRGLIGLIASQIEKYKIPPDVRR